MQTKNLWIGAVAVLAVVAAVAAYLYLYLERQAVEPEPAAEPPAPEVIEEPEIRHPIPHVETEPEELPEPLPPLDESDTAAQQTFAALAGKQENAGLLLPERIIRRIVATVDNLPRPKLAPKLRPVASPAGHFLVSGNDENLVLNPENYSRYAPFVELVVSIPADQLADAYFRYYPLLQQAYEELGYPSAYFNDRLVEVIDLLLATPEVEAPVKLVRPNVMYEFADRRLEALPAGQKLLIRMGPTNAAMIKQKLRDFRSEIVDQPADQTGDTAGAESDQVD